MKHIIKKVFPLLLVLFSFVFVQCKDDNDLTKPMSEFKIEEKSMSLRPGDIDYINIISGNDDYKAISKDSKIADVSIDGTKVKIRAISPGKTSIILFDLRSETNKVMNVEVLERIPGIDTDQKTTLRIIEGESSEINILSGSGKYEIGTIENEDILSAKVVYDDNGGAKVVVEGLKAGDSLLDIVDSNTTLKVTIQIKVEEHISDLALDTYSMTIMVGQTKKANIISGSGNYQVNPENHSIVSSSLDGSTITIKGLAIGKTNIGVADVRLVKGQKISVIKNIEVTVIAFESAASFVVDGIKYNPLDTERVEIVANTDKYKGNIEVPSTVEYNGNTYRVVAVGNSAFRGCMDLKEVILPEGIVDIKTMAFYQCVAMSKCNIPSTVRTIGYLSFANTGLMEMHIPASVEKIANLKYEGSTPEYSGYKNISFLQWTMLKTLTIDPANRHYKVVNNILYNYDMTMLMAAATKANYGKLTIPNGVSIISGFTFSECNTITDLILPNSIENIMNNAFHNCTKIEKIQIGTSLDGNAYLEVWPNGFNSCFGLKEIKSYMINPPYLYNGAFQMDYPDDPYREKATRKTAEIQVIIPRGTKEDYTSATTGNRWHLFPNISEM